MNESVWISELIREIGNRIAAKLDLSPELVRLTGSPTVRRFSITQKFTIGAASKSEPTTLIAKTRRYASKSAFADAVKEPRTRQLARQEYEAHSKAMVIFDQHESMSVPILFDLYEDLATIVMEVVPGQPLSRFVSSMRGPTRAADGPDLRTHFVNAGVWLREFHQGITDQEAAKWRRESVDELISNHLDALRRDGVAQRDHDRVVLYFENRLAEIDNRTMQIIGPIHGDFKPAHVILNDRRIAVIDFGTTRIEYGAADAGSFLADLACNAYGPRLVRQSSLHQLAAGFSSGYCDSEGTEAVVSLYCAVNLLRLWRKRRQRFPNGTPLRKFDKAIDVIRGRGLLNRTYVDRWFEQKIAGVLTDHAGHASTVERN